MALTIARMYSSHEAANAAATELQENGFNPQILPSPQNAPSSGQAEAPAESPGTADDALIHPMLQAGVPRGHAAVYAERIRRGEALVLVEPMFGAGHAAADILHRHNPVEVELPVTDAGVRPGWDPAAPLSSALGWRVLLDNPAPLSSYLKQPVLKPQPEVSPSLQRIRERSRDPAPLSAKVGMPVLSDQPAPLSSRLGWRTLLQVADPLSSRLGWRTLLPDPAPLSRRLGWATLLHDPAPLSNRLGWRTLLHDPAPLSRLLGWRTLSKD